jgi:hypothetical protein
MPVFRTMRSRAPRVVWLLTVVAMATAACGSTGAATHRPLAKSSSVQPSQLPPAAGPVGNRANVPWGEVGPGWALAEYTTGSDTVAGPVTLYLVSPSGDLYPVYQWPATTKPWRLVGWSGDGTRALFEVGSADQTTAHELTLRSGRVTTFALPFGSYTQGYTRPDGKNILVFVNDGITRYDRTGTLQQRLISGGLMQAISSPAGTAAVVTGEYGVTLVSNGGGVIRQLPIPGADPAVGCAPMRWLDATTVVVSCKIGRVNERVWAAPVSGAAPTALTALRDGTGPDLGDIDAWLLPGGTYVEALGSAGSFIGKQDASGVVTVVSVPGMAHVQFIVAAAAGRLLVESVGGTDTSPVRPKSLAWFDPQTGAVKTVLSAPANATGVAGVAPYNRDGEQHAWT